MSQQTVYDAATPSDPELIAAVRGGDAEAYGVLFERHRGAALSLARQIAGPSDADDLVSDAFMKVHRVLAGGGGPDVAFRAYLLTAIRRLHVDKIRASAKVTPSDDLEQFDPGTPFTDPAVEGFENAAAAKAFASLPERWQLVLWHLEVEGQKPAEIAPLLGMSANSVSALAYRAREGLRQAYLQMHMADTGAEECRWVTERLGAHVRKGLSKRDAAKVDQHLDECTKCAAVYLELTEVNSNLAGIIAPALLGTAAIGYLGAASAGTKVGIALLLFRARHLAKAHSALTAGGATAGVVAAGVTTVLVTQAFHPHHQVQTDAPVTNPGITSPTSPATTTTPDTSHHHPQTHKPPKHHPPKQQPPVLLAPTPTTVTPTQGPVVSQSYPNPQDSEPPAPPNSDDPGTPQIPLPTPQPPGPVDVTLGMQVTTLIPGSYVAVIDTSTADPATSLTMSIDISEFTSLAFAGWSCPAPTPDVTTYTCTADSASPPKLRILMVFGRDLVPTMSASVVAADNDDPDLSNNSASWTGPAQPGL
jgi:RNA polymerase sigma factor (sigma-70 family)